MAFNREVFAAKLRGLRNEKGFNQAELAELSGICADAICKYENAVVNPGADKVFSLAEALGCTPEYLMGWDERKAS